MISRDRGGESFKMLIPAKVGGQRRPQAQARMMRALNPGRNGGGRERSSKGIREKISIS